MNVIVDTSVWIDHFRHNNRTLVELMLRDSVLVHPMVIGEIACSTPPAPRNQSLENLAQLQPCYQATSAEVLALWSVKNCIDWVAVWWTYAYWLQR